jgi:hypothetical protein
MPSQRTVQNLIDAIRQYSNEETANPASAFVTDTEIMRRITEAMYTLYDLMLNGDPHFYVLTASFTLSSTNSFALSTLPDPGFYRVMGLEYQAGGPSPIDVHRFTFAERNRQGRRTYSIEGANLLVYPPQNFAGTYTLWYNPRLTEPTSTASVLDVFMDNYQTYIIASAAAAVMAKAEESDPGPMLALRAAEEARIMAAIAGRNAEPEQIPDVTGSFGQNAWDGMF